MNTETWIKKTVENKRGYAYGKGKTIYVKNHLQFISSNYYDTNKLILDVNLKSKRIKYFCDCAYSVNRVRFLLSCLADNCVFGNLNTGEYGRSFSRHCAYITQNDDLWLPNGEIRRMLEVHRVKRINGHLIVAERKWNSETSTHINGEAFAFDANTRRRNFVVVWRKGKPELYNQGNYTYFGFDIKSSKIKKAVYVGDDNSLDWLRAILVADRI